MEIQGLQALYAGHKSVKALVKALQDGSARTIFAEGLCASAAPLLFSSVAAACPQVMACPYVFVLDDAEEAGYFYHDLTQILGEQEVFYFPSSFRRAVKFGQRDAANEILRTEVISRLSAGHRPLFVVTYPEAVMEKVVSRQKLNEQTLRLRAGERVDITFVEETLRAFGFRRVDYVYEPGQFAVRGSILDVFSFSSEWPYRVDFFGDEVDSIRTFEVQTQLSRDKQEEIVIVPELAGYVQGKVPFTDFLPPETVLVMKDLFFLRDVADRVYADGFSAQALMDEQARTEMEEAERHEKLRADLMLVDGSALMKGMLDFRRVEVGNKPSATPQATVRFHLTAQPIFHKNFELVTRTFHEYLEKGYTLYILADSAKQTDRLASIFTEQASGIGFIPVDRTLHAGFADDDLKACFFTDHQIFDRFHKYNLRSDKARSGKVALSLKELQEFNIGDYVVHVDHGVGKFGGLVRIPNGDTMQEVIKIIYQNDDVVFVSIHSLHKVSKYRGKEGEPPRLNKLGTGAWERLKERTKTKIKDIARDLIKLYSLRRQEKGFAFSPDSFMQHELEASFLYEDTPDQLKATQAVKADMERDRPMDRLVCGDVGFGKTEVAIRAAFKACADNKQVAVLVPTTVLAYQHFQTFSSRLKGMPVRVDYLSRARSAAKTKEILRDLADGKINIIVGTHKLIGKSVKFKDLGLLIIDEEQKFGVVTKEKLRQMKVNVDTLTLTATPIPRTLQFSLMGARDLSVIQTPPPNRYPVQTEVHTFSTELIAEAVNFEMSRNGQVFIVNNRISSLYDLEALLHKHVPDARVCVGHGQMPPEELENIIFGFVHYDYDVLVSTTIIESGIDNPHTKPVRFWQDVIAAVTKKHPEILFLAEAFTRPGMMRALSYVGFTQSHCYFPWRNTKEELGKYLETTNGDDGYYQHNTFWPTTPDILTAYVRDNGIAGHAVRAVLAAMGSPSWGIYNGFELIENKQRPGFEEQIDNEKYEVKVRDWSAADKYGIAELLTNLNRVRREHPKVFSYHNLTVLESSDPNILAFARHTPAELTGTDKPETLIVVVNLDGHEAHQAMVHLELPDYGIDPKWGAHIHDELTGRDFAWSWDNFVSLAPWADVAHIFTVVHED